MCRAEARAFLMRLRSTPPVAIATPARCTPPVDRARRAAAAVCRAQRPRGQTSCVVRYHTWPTGGWMAGRGAAPDCATALSYTVTQAHTRRHAHTSHHQSDYSGPSPSHSFPHSSTPLPSQRRQRSQERDLVGDRTQNESRRFFSGSLFLYTHGLSTPMQRATRSLGRGRLCRPHAEPTHGAAQRHRAAHGRRADRHHSWWLARGERQALFSPLPSAPRP